MQPRNRTATVLSRLAFALSLTACAPAAPLLAPPVKIQVEQQEIPAYLLNPAPAPAVPEIQKQSEVGLLLLEEIDAGADCRAKMACIRNLQAGRSDCLVDNLANSNQTPKGSPP